MPLAYPQFVEPFGSADKVPDLELYQYIIDPLVQKDLANRSNLGLEKLLESPLVQEVRRRCKSDLFWLNRYFLWGTNPEGVGKPIEESKVTEATHRPIADLFVKKDDTKMIAQQDVYKERTLLYPRGSLKSTFDVADVVQWILNFPLIRILYLTATDPLAVGFVDETKGHFVIRTDEPSLMNLFFPEYCVEEKHLGAADRFVCPLFVKKKVRRKEPTVLALSIGSTMSGFHFEVIKVDDAVDTKNSETVEACHKVIKNMHINMKMLMPYGYKDFIGTRYNDEDLYGAQIEKNLGDLETTSGLNLPDPRPWTLTVNPALKTKVLVGVGWKIKPEAEEDIRKGKLREQDCGPEHYYVLFPENLPFQKLSAMRNEDESSFEGQINQNPRPLATITFDRGLLTRHTVPHTDLPLRGPVSITWDFAFSKKKGRDFSTAAVGVYDDRGRLYIIDLIRDRFNHTTLARTIVDLAARWRPVVIGIENTSGSDLLEPTILAEAKMRGRPEVLSACAKIDWFSVNNAKDAKKQRMASLHPWLMQDRLFFAAHLPHLETLYFEFERCLTSHKHDDIPDVISQQIRYAPRMQMMLAKGEINVGLSKDQAAYNLLYGEYGEDGPIPCDQFGRPNFSASPIILPEPEVDRGPVSNTPAGLPNILGAGLTG